jgi:hypothetical protein
MTERKTTESTRGTLQDAASAIAHARRALASEGAVDLTSILPAIDRCSAELLDLSPEIAEQVRPELLALLDDVQAAIRPLAAERRQLGEDLRRSNSQRAAGNAYHRSQRL